jgi:CDP-paratose synthetase
MKGNLLITGINGFLGSHLAKSLASDYKIIGLENTSKELLRIKGCNFKVYSAENGVPEELFQEQTVNIIIHTATIYGRQNESFNTIVEANLFQPLSLLDNAIKNHCGLFINTDTVLDRFISTYALTKQHFQEWLYMRRSEIKVINLQLEHIYGPFSSNANLITNMIERLKQNEPSIDLTLGNQKRDFIYIDDVVSAYQTVLRREPHITDNYTSYHVSTNRLISIKDLLLLLKKMTHSSTNLNFGAIPSRENELMQSLSDNSALLALGWEPKTTLSEGLNMIIEQ